MKLLANENFLAKSILYLRSKGFDISSIGMDWPCSKDEEVMHIAMEENRTILTFDRDYGELIFKLNYKPRCGVIYLRLNEYKAEEPARLIELLINTGEYDFHNALTVVDKNAIRQRKY